MKLKLMPGMTLEQQIQGTRAAIKSLSSNQGGPIWLLPSLRKRLQVLTAEKESRQRYGSKENT
jgi:hypothetical protein